MAATKAWRQRNPEVNKERRRSEHRAHYLKNKERTGRRHKAWRERNPDYYTKRYRKEMYGDDTIEINDMHKDRFRKARALGFRSGLEVKVANDLKARGVDFTYEVVKIQYTVPESKHTFTPDFVLPGGVIVETKGYFEPADRKKHLCVRESNPKADIRFLFQRAATPIRKGSKTTYAMWCEKNGFLWAEKRIPEEWIHAA